jgi:hypothetical protein
MNELDDRQRLWERFMQMERKELEDRKNGELAKVLGPAMRGESQEELDRLAREDREKAEEGILELRDGDEVWYKRVDEISREDRSARIEAQSRRLEWVQERLKSSPEENR